MVKIFFFNGRPDDFDDRLNACEAVFAKPKYIFDSSKDDCLGTFASRYKDFIAHIQSKRICFLHTTPLRGDIIDKRLVDIDPDQQYTYTVWFSGGEIDDRNAFRHYFPNSIFAEPTEDGYGPDEQRFWANVLRDMIKEGWI